LESVFRQTHMGFEVIVVDDGSTDNTKQTVNQLQETHENLIYLWQENCGASRARNTGVRHATGEIIVYIDSDDIADPLLLEKIYETLQSDPRKVFGIVNHTRRVVLIDQAGNTLDELPPFVMTDNAVKLQDYYHWKVKTTTSGLFHVRALWNICKWDEALHYLEDWELLLQFGAVDHDGFVFILDPLIYYTQSYGGDGMCSNAKYSDWAKAFDDIYQKHKNDPLMTGQTWWPERVEKYTKLQKEVDAGTHLPQVYKYFPNFKG